MLDRREVLQIEESQDDVMLISSQVRTPTFMID